MKAYDLIIIGGGPAGLAAAVAARDNGAGRPCIKNQSLSGSIGKYLSESYFAGRIRIER